MSIGELVVAPLPGFVTITGKVPAESRLPVALRLVGLIYLAVQAMPPTLTVEAAWKLEPLSDMVWFDPVLKVLGELDHTFGVGCMMLTADVPLMPEGLLVACTVTMLGVGMAAGAV
jgi:hypothetical protein